MKPQGSQVRLGNRARLFRLFLAEKHQPDPFYDALADRTIAGLQFPTEGALVLDAGSGPGHYSRALERAGARVIAVELLGDDLDRVVREGTTGLGADARRLPFSDAVFDGVFCSNMLEHTPDPAAVMAEIERVLRPGAWAWVSWTNWYSPWGGHEIVPLHYLGPRLGLAVWRRLKGEPRKNVPFEGLWPTHVGRTLAMVRARRGLHLVAAVPRYYPSQRWILRIPVLREVATWNCLLLLRRVADT
ncbi:MAG: class I SAM-dependent methyltransferase [Actinobacteria bacterium]|nr:class I SAM-dependent methyltransferase [Actinomycetota bacterium]